MKQLRVFGKKSLSLLLAFILTVSLFAVIPIKADAATDVIYIERRWDEASDSAVGVISYCSDYTNIANRTSDTLTGWYYVGVSQTINNRLTVSGTVNIILEDYADLTLNKGISVPEGTTLNIFGQYHDKGKIVAKANNHQAAIGSNGDNDNAESGAGTINIHGGIIEATGGSNAAGIGGGNKAHGGNITIYGGTVTAKAGTDAAGIGSGNEYGGSFRGSVTIYNGTVTATGGECGAGIGGGDACGGIDVTIMGGDVTANGGWYAAGIGGGEDRSSGDILISGAVVSAKSEYAAAGIGGGKNGNSGKITITNATVNAISGYNGGAGIGGGSSGTNGDITIYDSVVTAETPDFNKGLNGTGAAIGAGFDRSQKGLITIEKSKIYAESGNGAERSDGGGAGIGGGAYGNGGTIIIKESEVVACAYGGAGIGGGDAGTFLRSSGGNGGSTTIQNSKVTAVSQCRGAGIGGGDEGNGGTVMIFNSEVIAAGGSSSYVPVLYKPLPSASPAEGFAYFLEAALLATDCYGAGIGGGDGGDGANVTIGNSTVTAIVEEDEGALAIGWGCGGDKSGNLSLENNLMVSKGKAETQSDGTCKFVVTDPVERNKRYDTCRRESSAHIEVCPHDNYEWRWFSGNVHSKHCFNCEINDLHEIEEHKWDSNYTCTVCGGTATPTQFTITEKDNNGDIVQTIEYPYNSKYTLPECTHAPDGMSFAAWCTVEEPIRYFLPGDDVYIGYNDKFTAIYQSTYEISYINKKGLPDSVDAKKVSEAEGILFSGWYFLDTDIEMNTPLYLRGDVHLILKDRKTLSFTGRYSYDRRNSLYAINSDSSLCIYGQTQQTGTIDNCDFVAAAANFNQYGGVFKGDKDVDSQYWTINIQRGTFKAPYTLCKKLSIHGGNVDLGYFVGGEDGVTLDWSSPYDSITFDDHFYERDKLGTVTVAEDKAFSDGVNKFKGKLTDAQIDSLAGKTLTPAIDHDFAEPDWVWSDEYTQAKVIFRCKDCDYEQEVPAGVEYEDDGQYRTSSARCIFNGEEYSTTQTFRVIFNVIISDTENGSVIAEPTTGRAGDKVRLDVTPNEGYSLSSLTVTDQNGNEVECNGLNFYLPESEVTVTAAFMKLESIEYIDEFGDTSTASALALTGSETELSTGWYYISGNVSFNRKIELNGEISLILCNGAVMDIEDNDISGGDPEPGTVLNIYRTPGEEEGRLKGKTLRAETINIAGGLIDTGFGIEADVLNILGGSLSASDITIQSVLNMSGGIVDAYRRSGWIVTNYGDTNISGGTMNVTTDYGDGFNIYGDLTVSGGEVDIHGDLSGSSDESVLTVSGGKVSVTGEMRGQNIIISGGNVTVLGQLFSYSDLTLGWTGYSDSFMAATIAPVYNIFIAEGQQLTDGTEIFSGNYTYMDLDSFQGKTLTPYSTDRFVGHSLSLSGDIGVNFYVNIPTSDRTRNDIKVVFTWQGNTSEPKTATIPFSEDLKSNGLFRFTCNVSAAEMCDEITAALYYGSELKGTDVYSVRSYADVILSDDEWIVNYREKNSDYVQLSTLIKTMLNYGAAAQTQFSHNPGDLANDGIDHPLNSLSNSEINGIMGSIPDKSVDLSAYGVEYYGYSLLLKTKTNLRFYFRIKDRTKYDNSVFKLGNVSEVHDHGENYVYIELPDISAAELADRNMLTVGDVRMGAFSALTYVKDVLQNDNGEQPLTNTVTAIYRYHEASVNYFNSAE